KAPGTTTTGPSTARRPRSMSFTVRGHGKRARGATGSTPAASRCARPDLRRRRGNRLREDRRRQDDLGAGPARASGRVEEGERGPGGAADGVRGGQPWRRPAAGAPAKAKDKVIPP